MLPKLVQAVNDKSLPLKAKAKAVYEYSCGMMKNVLECSTTGVISAIKEGILKIVEIIISENETKLLSIEAWVVAMQHHEYPDGKGYPRRLTKIEIHPYASICCIADVYDVLTGKRSYKKEKTPLEALKIMRQMNW